jgi:hypothetical protein
VLLAETFAWCGDALSGELDSEWYQPDTVIMNPPFSLGLSFVEYALSHTRRGATIVALLRLAFLEGQGRAELHRKHPSDVYVLPKRPSFTGKGTDSSAYGWFVWGPGRGGRWQVLDIQAQAACSAA